MKEVVFWEYLFKYFYMEENTVANTNLTELEWDSLMIPDDFSTDEKEEHQAIVTEYISNQTNDQVTDLASIDQVVEINIDDSLLEPKELELEKHSNAELFEYFQEDKVDNDPSIQFPRIKRINVLFWLLHNLGTEEIINAKIAIKNPESVSVIFHHLIESARFFDFIKKVEVEEKIYYVATSQYEEFLKHDSKEQYPFFLTSIGHNATVSEAIQIQLNDPIYDSISRQMVYNILVRDPNIQEESLSNDEVTKIVNNLRYWYLNIKKAVLDN